MFFQAYFSNPFPYYQVSTHLRLPTNILCDVEGQRPLRQQHYVTMLQPLRGFPLGLRWGGADPLDTRVRAPGNVPLRGYGACFVGLRLCYAGWIACLSWHGKLTLSQPPGGCVLGWGAAVPMDIQ
jgi:hypothetical protein